MDRERARRNRLKKKEGNKCREGTPIASVPPLGAYPGGRRKVLGELKDGGNRRKSGRKEQRGEKRKGYLE